MHDCRPGGRDVGCQGDVRRVPQPLLRRSKNRICLEVAQTLRSASGLEAKRDSDALRSANATWKPISSTTSTCATLRAASHCLGGLFSRRNQGSRLEVSKGHLGLHPNQGQDAAGRGLWAWKDLRLRWGHPLREAAGSLTGHGGQKLSE